jgi:hypothetical protein
VREGLPQLRPYTNLTVQVDLLGYAGACNASAVTLQQPSGFVGTSVALAVESRPSQSLCRALFRCMRCLVTDPVMALPLQWTEPNARATAVQWSVIASPVLPTDDMVLNGTLLPATGTVFAGGGSTDVTFGLFPVFYTTAFSSSVSGYHVYQQVVSPGSTVTGAAVSSAHGVAVSVRFFQFTGTGLVQVVRPNDPIALATSVFSLSSALLGAATLALLLWETVLSALRQRSGRLYSVSKMSASQPGELGVTLLPHRSGLEAADEEDSARL